MCTVYSRFVCLDSGKFCPKSSHTYIALNHKQGQGKTNKQKLPKEHLTNIWIQTISAANCPKGKKCK